MEPTAVQFLNANKDSQKDESHISEHSRDDRYLTNHIFKAKISICICIK